jgi:hypothetical protein
MNTPPPSNAEEGTPAPRPAFHPHPLGPLYTVLHCLALPFDGEPLTIPDLLRTMGSEGETLGGIDLHRVELSLGSSVRIELQFRL